MKSAAARVHTCRLSAESVQYGDFPDLMDRVWWGSGWMPPADYNVPHWNRVASLMPDQAARTGAPET